MGFVPMGPNITAEGQVQSLEVPGGGVQLLELELDPELDRFLLAWLGWISSSSLSDLEGVSSLDLPFLWSMIYLT